MLRITKGLERRRQVVLYLEGHLAGNSCEVLEEECRRWRGLEKHVLLDLSRLMLVDRRGARLLISLRSDRVEATHVSPLIADLLLDAES